MKKLITSLFALSLFAYVSGTAATAQGKGGGGGGQHVPAGGAPQNNSGHTDHGKSADHQGTNTKDQTLESRIESNPQLKAKIESLLPMGMDLKTATMGFKNEGQCVAALNVAKNLNIPFDQLQAKMTGN